MKTKLLSDLVANPLTNFSYYNPAAMAWFLNSWHCYWKTLPVGSYCFVVTHCCQRRMRSVHQIRILSYYHEKIIESSLLGHWPNFFSYFALNRVACNPSRKRKMTSTPIPINLYSFLIVSYWLTVLLCWLSSRSEIAQHRTEMYTIHDNDDSSR